MNQTENIPEVLFKAREGDNQNLGGGCSIGGKWKDLTSNELFKGKKVICTFKDALSSVHDINKIKNYR